jgi:hypothetical protein
MRLKRSKLISSVGERSSDSKCSVGKTEVKSDSKYIRLYISQLLESQQKKLASDSPTLKSITEKSTNLIESASTDANFFFFLLHTCNLVLLLTITKDQKLHQICQKSHNEIYHKHVRSNKVVILQISLKLQNAPKSNYHSRTLSKSHQKHNNTCSL